jgi:hypothetical protein
MPRSQDASRVHHGYEAHFGMEQVQIDLDAASDVTGWQCMIFRAPLRQDASSVSLQVIEAVLDVWARAGVVSLSASQFRCGKRAALEAWGAHVMAMGPIVFP